MSLSTISFHAFLGLPHRLTLNLTLPLGRAVFRLFSAEALAHCTFPLTQQLCNFSHQFFIILLKTCPFHLSLFRYTTVVMSFVPDCCLNATHDNLNGFHWAPGFLKPGLKSLVWNVALCSRDVDVDADRRRLQAFEMWIWRRM